MPSGLQVQLICGATHEELVGYCTIQLHRLTVDVLTLDAPPDHQSGEGHSGELLDSLSGNGED